MEVVVRVDNNRSSLTMLERAELVGRVQKSLQEIEEVGNTMSAVTFAPPLNDQTHGPGPQRPRSATPGTNRLERHREEYIEGGFLAIDGDDELWRINARVGALNDVDYGLFLDDLRAKVEPVLAGRTNANPHRAGQGRQGNSRRRGHRRGRRPPRPTIRRRWESTPSTPDWCRSSTRPSIKCWSAWAKTSSTTC